MEESMTSLEDQPSLEEQLLLAARNGDTNQVSHLIKESQAGRSQLDLNCRGESKSNRSWTALHLASYFGKLEAARVLLQAGAEVDALNSSGDTPLHKAALTNRLDLVNLLVEFGADVHTINCEGFSPFYLASLEEVKKMLSAVAKSEQSAKEDQLLSAVAEGNMGKCLSLLRSKHPPDINCIDSIWNTPLIRASFQDNREMAVVMLQNGADPEICNTKGQKAYNVAKSPQMKELLEAHSRVAHKFEGPLLKMFGLMHRYKLYWVVLDQGVVTYYRTRADAVAKEKRRGYRYLTGAKIKPGAVEEISQNKSFAFTVIYPDEYRQVFKVDINNSIQISREKWMSVFQEHSNYSSPMDMRQRTGTNDSSSDTPSLSTLEEKLENARLQQEILSEHAINVKRVLNGYASTGSSIQVSQNLASQIQKLTDLSDSTCTALRQCLEIMTKHDKLLETQLKQEKDRSGALEQALTCLAHEHHQLEGCLSSASPEYFSPTDSISSEGIPFAVNLLPDSFRGRTASVRSSASGDEYFSVGDSDSEDSSNVSFNSLESSENEEIVWNEEGSRVVVDDKRREVKGEEVSKEEGVMEAGVSATTVALQQSHINETHSHEENEDEIRTMSTNSVQNISGNHKLSNGSNGNKPDFVLRGCSRKKLPSSSLERGHISVWTILKQSIGKDLSKITMPVVLNEPLSFLQRCSEYTEQAELLTLAGQTDDPVDRMKYVAAFVAGSPASNVDRTSKPFNPLLGETYEQEREDLQVKMILEQVSHHPPVSAFHTTSPHYRYHGSVYPKLKFWGKNVELQSKGVLTVDLPKYGESYTWHSVDTAVHNIIVGKLWVELFGQCEINNHKTGHKCVLTFKPAGWFGRDLHKVEGYIEDKNGKKLRRVFGKWPEYFYCVPVNEQTESQREEREGWGSFFIGTSSSSPVDKHQSSSSEFIPEGRIDQAELVWKNKAKPDYADEYYSFTNFTMQLNELSEEMKTYLPRTDTRLRPDVRELENGNIDKASSEKHRLEEKQRASRKLRNRNRSGWEPLWFKEEQNPHTGEMDWLYKGGYWDRRFDRCPDIF